MSEGLNFACPSCGNQYPWTAELAGKKGRCKCGHVMKIPADPPGSSTATKSAAVMARPMPRPQPMPTSQHREPEEEEAEVPTEASNGEAAETTGEAKPKKSLGGAFKKLWPKSKKK